MRFGATEDLEVHTLVGHETVALYLFGIGSLHRFAPEVRVVIHDDGSLTLFDRTLLRRRVRGARMISKLVADKLIAARLAGYPLLIRAREESVRMCQIIDYYVLASSEHVIGMDSDVVFLAKPEALLKWATAAEPKPSLLYSPERNPKGPHWVPTLMPGAPYAADLCCGLVCAQVSRFFAPEHLESFVASVPDALLEGQRFVTQMLYSLMAGRPGQRAASMGAHYESGRLRWLDDDPERVICHYFASHERQGAAQNLLEERELFEQIAGRPLAQLAESWR